MPLSELTPLTQLMTWIGYLVAVLSALLDLPMPGDPPAAARACVLVLAFAVSVTQPGQWWRRGPNGRVRHGPFTVMVVGVLAYLVAVWFVTATTRPLGWSVFATVCLWGAVTRLGGQVFHDETPPWTAVASGAAAIVLGVGIVADGYFVGAVGAPTVIRLALFGVGGVITALAGSMLLDPRDPLQVLLMWVIFPVVGLLTVFVFVEVGLTAAAAPVCLGAGAGAVLAVLGALRDHRREKGGASAGPKKPLTLSEAFRTEEIVAYAALGASWAYVLWVMFIEAPPGAGPVIAGSVIGLAGGLGAAFGKGLRDPRAEGAGQACLAAGVAIAILPIAWQNYASPSMAGVTLVVAYLILKGLDSAVPPAARTSLAGWFDREAAPRGRTRGGAATAENVAAERSAGGARDGEEIPDG